MSLNTKIGALAETFAAGVLAAIRSASLQDILSAQDAAPTVAKRGPGRPRKATGTAASTSRAAAAPTVDGARLARRSPAQLEQVIAAIVAALKQAPDGLRSEHLQRVLKLDKKEIGQPLAHALAAKKITKKGQRRSTTYFAK